MQELTYTFLVITSGKSVVTSTYSIFANFICVSCDRRLNILALHQSFEPPPLPNWGILRAQLRFHIVFIQFRFPMQTTVYMTFITRLYYYAKHKFHYLQKLRNNTTDSYSLTCTRS